MFLEAYINKWSSKFIILKHRFYHFACPFCNSQWISFFENIPLKSLFIVTHSYNLTCLLCIPMQIIDSSQTFCYFLNKTYICFSTVILSPLLSFLFAISTIHSQLWSEKYNVENSRNKQYILNCTNSGYNKIMHCPAWIISLSSLSHYLC
jgi:hypothetical protein